MLAATDLQDGAGLPFESLDFDVPAGLRVVIARHSNAATRAIRLALSNGRLGLAPDVAAASGGEFTAGPLTPVELFSSDGWRRVFYDRDGRAIKRGKVTFARNGGELRKKPDLSGADGVQTSLSGSSGLNPFFGTSAAAAHIAGIAALIKAAVGGATSRQIRNALTASALDIEASGVDRDSGKGIASAPAALKKAGAEPSVFLELSDFTVTPVGSSAVLPGGSVELSVQLINNGGAKARSVSGSLTSSSPFVQITQPVSTYPTILPGGTAPNSSNFAFNVNPAAPCGAVLPFTVTIDFTGNGTHPTSLSIEIQVGRAASIVTTTSYTGPAVAIPDNNPTGVNLPLGISAVGVIAQLRFRIDGTACNATIGTTTVGVNHTWVGDLVFTLTSPGGTTVTVIDQPGGPGNSGNNLCQTLLDDTAATSIQDVLIAQAPFTGTFRPANALGAFSGEDANGTWMLNVSDRSFLDTGNVRAFSIETSGFDCAP